MRETTDPRDKNRRGRGKERSCLNSDECFESIAVSQLNIIEYPLFKVNATVKVAE